MAKFITPDFLLSSSTAKHLYHDIAAKLPIIDYHCHLSPKMIADDHRFASITELWLGGDHYKWRAMRANGVDERFITGDASDFEKFEQWAATLPYAFRNPLYHWSHLELSTAFGIDEVLKQLNGRSCVLYMGHYCNWEWVTSLRLHVPQSYHLGQIYHPLKDKATDRFFLKLRGHFHSESIPMVDTLRRIVSLRNEGTPFMIGFIADQTPSWANIRYWLPFLNHDTPVFIGTERIAHQTKSPAYYAAMTRPKRGYYHCEFVLLHDEPQTLPEHQLTDRYFKALEQSIQGEPAYWLWSHRRWKRQRQQPPTAS